MRMLHLSKCCGDGDNEADAPARHLLLHVCIGHLSVTRHLSSHRSGAVARETPHARPKTAVISETDFSGDGPCSVLKLIKDELCHNVIAFASLRADF